MHRKTKQHIKRILSFHCAQVKKPVKCTQSAQSERYLCPVPECLQMVTWMDQHLVLGHKFPKGQKQFKRYNDKHKIMKKRKKLLSMEISQSGDESEDNSRQIKPKKESQVRLAGNQGMNRRTIHAKLRKPNQANQTNQTNQQITPGMKFQVPVGPVRHPKERRNKGRAET